MNSERHSHRAWPLKPSKTCSQKDPIPKVFPRRSISKSIPKSGRMLLVLGRPRTLGASRGARPCVEAGSTGSTGGMQQLSLANCPMAVCRSIGQCLNGLGLIASFPSKELATSRPMLAPVWRLSKQGRCFCSELYFPTKAQLLFWLWAQPGKAHPSHDN